MLSAILHRARHNVEPGSERPDGDVTLTLLQVLRAYEEVLLDHGTSPAEDSHYYRVLLQWSLSSNTYYAWRRCLSQGFVDESPGLGWSAVHTKLVEEAQAES